MEPGGAPAVPTLLVIRGGRVAGLADGRRPAAGPSSLSPVPLTGDDGFAYLPARRSARVVSPGDANPSGTYQRPAGLACPLTGAGLLPAGAVLKTPSVVFGMAVHMGRPGRWGRGDPIGSLAASSLAVN